jgi:hypothetical protein
VATVLGVRRAVGAELGTRLLLALRRRVGARFGLGLGLCSWPTAHILDGLRRRLDLTRIYL